MYTDFFWIIFSIVLLLNKMLRYWQYFTNRTQFKLGEIKAISEVRIGDKILASDSAGNQKYSTVIFIPHKQNNIATLFAHLHTKTRDIKLTPNHVIPAGDCSGKKPLPLLYASQVNIKMKNKTKICFSQIVNRFRSVYKFYVKKCMWMLVTL